MEVLCDFQHPKRVAVGVVVLWVITSFNSWLVMLGGVVALTLGFLFLQSVCFESEVDSRKNVVSKWVEVNQLNEENLRSCSSKLLEVQSGLVKSRLEGLEQMASLEAEAARRSRPLKKAALESKLNWLVSHTRLQEEEELRNLHGNLKKRVEKQRRKNVKELKAVKENQRRRAQQLEDEEFEMEQEQRKSILLAKQKSRNKIEAAERQYKY